VLIEQPEVTGVKTFDSSTATPTPAQFAAADVVVELGDNCADGYLSQKTYGNRLANYLDHGGVALQAAYDNWDHDQSYPGGRFKTAGYAPLALGLNQNDATALGQLPEPSNPLVQGLDTFATTSNTTTPLTPGATLLATWLDGRNAIAVKGRVVATSASADDESALPNLARLAVNAAEYFHATPTTKIKKATINANAGTAAFTYKAVGQSSGFQCELKKPGAKAAFTSCPAHKAYKHLTPGSYTFEVAAVGLGGPDPTPAKKSFHIGPAAAARTSASSGLKVLVTGDCEETDVAAAMTGKPGFASVKTFDVSGGTPTAAELAAADIVVDTGAPCHDGYADPATYGNRLADYLDHGGVLVQVAYDDWNSAGRYPTGRFESGTYAPLLLGQNDNFPTQLGKILKPKSAIVKGLGTFSTPDNTTNALAPGATLLAKWADGRNAIAVKGRAVATSASPDTSANPAIVRLVKNTGRHFNAVPGTKIVESLTNSLSGYAEFWYDPIGPHTGFQCELKKAGKKATFKPCGAHKKYTHLKPGKYTFEVAAVGLGGADPTPAKKTFTVFG
jgi:hypothetical protein